MDDTPGNRDSTTSDCTIATLVPGAEPLTARSGPRVQRGREELKKQPPAGGVRTGRVTKGSQNPPPVPKRPLPLVSTAPQPKRTKIHTTEGSPWAHLDKLYELNLGGYVDVVSRKSTGEVFTLRSFASSDRKLSPLAKLNDDENILDTCEVYVDGDTKLTYALSRRRALVSLEQFAAVALTEVQLANIAHQLLDGLLCIEKHKYIHGAIEATNVLLTASGTLLIANPEMCSERTNENKFKDVEGFRKLMADLMGIELRGGEPISPRGWPTEAIQLLNKPLKESLQPLKGIPFLKERYPLEKARLEGSAWTANDIGWKEVEFPVPRSKLWDA